MKAYVVLQIWTDSMENEVSASYGYTPVGVSLDEDLARKYAERAGVMPEEVSWPPVGGKPRRTVLTVDLLSEEDL